MDRQAVYLCHLGTVTWRKSKQDKERISCGGQF